MKLFIIHTWTFEHPIFPQDYKDDTTAMKEEYRGMKRPYPIYLVVNQLTVVSPFDEKVYILRDRVPIKPILKNPKVEEAV